MPRRTPLVLLRIDLSEAVTVSDSVVGIFLRAMKDKASAMITDTRPTDTTVAKGDGEAKTIKGSKTKSLYEDG